MDYRYTVQPGDSLSKIAGALTLSMDYWSALAQYNNIANPGMIVPGQVILIPENWLKPVNIVPGGVPGTPSIPGIPSEPAPITGVVDLAKNPLAVGLIVGALALMLLR